MGKDHKNAVSAKKLEPLYIVEKRGQEVVITGFTERNAAEKLGVRHLTVIIVPFVADGKKAGRWIVHDRTAKQWAKGKIDCKTPSFNFFGGHATADPTELDLIGQAVPLDICLAAARRELEEEFLRNGEEMELEVWLNQKKTDAPIYAAPYQARELIPIGFASYADRDNVELSYFYALPVPGSDLDNLVAADNYIDESAKDTEDPERDVFLRVDDFFEAELLVMAHMQPDIEICDAVTRLWCPENKAVIEKLRTVIEGFCEKSQG
ncbi:MAG: hypothetical protein ACOX2M_08485 [Fastidiosipilaceae bacterium]|jgi:hypothetical protein